MTLLPALIERSDGCDRGDDCDDMLEESDSNRGDDVLRMYGEGNCDHDKTRIIIGGDEDCN